MLQIWWKLAGKNITKTWNGMTENGEGKGGNADFYDCDD
jgi:hypothetical protein